MAILKRIGKKWINSYWRRLLILVGAAIGGYCLSKWGFPWLDYWLGFSPRVDKYLEPLLFGLPAFVCLWFFRTYDTQQQIQQGNFVTGVDKLMQNSTLVIDVGVEILLQVSAKTDAFDDAIRLVFIKRLKTRLTASAPPDFSILPDGGKMAEHAKKFFTRSSYTQHILRWLIAKQDNYKVKPDLSGMRCDYQEFKGAELELVKILPTPEEAPGEATFWDYPVSLVGADCTALNFDGVAFDIFDTDEAVNITKDGKHYKTSSRRRSPSE